eukprot:1196097-Prorocentrum_minimum.AAC.5
MTDDATAIRWAGLRVALGAGRSEGSHAPAERSRRCGTPPGCAALGHCPSSSRSCGLATPAKKRGKSHQNEALRRVVAAIVLGRGSCVSVGSRWAREKYLIQLLG